jgi:CheY-like chemotaxis protein
LRSTKILVVSGLPEEQLQRALDLGADACVNKPFGAHEIIDQVALLSGVDVSASSGLIQTA